MKAEYANNLYVKKGKFGTKISIKADAFIEDLKAKKNKDGWVNIEIKETKSGDKLYAVYDNWVPGASSDSKYTPKSGSSAGSKRYEKPTVSSSDSDGLPF